MNISDLIPSLAIVGVSLVGNKYHASGNHKGLANAKKDETIIITSISYLLILQKIEAVMSEKQVILKCSSVTPLQK